jgi:Matrixin
MIQRVALTLAVLISLQVDAAFYLPYRMMSTSAKPFPYYVDNRSAMPAGISIVNVQTEVNAAWKQWNDVSCAAPKVAYKGFTGNTVANPADPFDGFSVTPVFVTNKNDPGYKIAFDGSFTSALTIPRSYAGILESCEIYLNAVDFKFSTAAVTPADAFDLRSVILHEAGHCLGLDHFAETDSVMFSAVRKGERLSQLSAADINGLCERNPAAGAPGTVCLAGNKCSGSGQPPLKCLTQDIGTGTNEAFCTRGCDFSAQEACEFPLVCLSSTAFAPAFNGACLLPQKSVTAVGRSCGNADECGSTLSLCIPPESRPSGIPAWVGGYCTQSCSAGKQVCPAGSECIDLGGSFGRSCVQSCRPGLADCRPEYVCVPTSATAGVCGPKCANDADCGNSNFVCRLCDGMCVGKQNPAGQIGDSCTDDATCGPGQQCLPISDRSTQKQCTEQCARGCGSCTNGASCQSILRGSLYCVRECTGVGTCPAGQQCSTSPSGRFCIPSCKGTTDCEGGNVCVGGECVRPSDAGCGAFCEVDGGMVIGPPVRDAGTGPSQAGGCGCNSESSIGPLLVLSIFFLQHRRRVDRRVQGGA